MSDRAELIKEVEELNAQYLRTVQRATMPEWLDLELTTAQLKTLLVLNSGSPMTIGQVREQLDVTLPTASHLVDKLVRMGLVERHEDPQDRRRIVASITDAGRERVRRLRRGSGEIFRTWFEQLDDEDLRACLPVMRKLLSIAQRSVPTSGSPSHERMPSEPRVSEPPGSESQLVGSS